MIETPKIVETSAQQTAVIRFTIPRAEIQAVMGQAIGEVIGVVSAQGIGPAGPVFSHHFRMDPEVFDFEVGVAVSNPVAPTGRVQPSQLPAANKVARTVYHGGYEGLGGAWGEFVNWLASNGHIAKANLWECYVDGPHSSPNPEDWRTELYRPLA